MHVSMFINVRAAARAAAIAAACGLAGAAAAQPEIRWSTIDGGGGEISTGGTLSLRGVIGQPDAARYAGGGTLNLRGGFIPGTVTQPCPADLNDDGVSDLVDFFDFLNAFDDTDAYADFTQDGTVDLFDFFDFLNAFDLSC